MGNKKFKLSEMIPNAWFYKLKDMSRRTRNHPPAKKNKQPSTTTSTTSSSSLTYSSLSSASSSSYTASIPTETSKLPNKFNNNILSHQRKSYYFTRELNSHMQPIPMEDKKSQQTQLPESQIKSPKQKRRSIITTGCSCRASIDLKSDDYPISSPDSSELVSDHDQNPQNDIVIDINDQGLGVIPEVELRPILTKKQPKTRNSVGFEDRNGNNASSVRRLSVSSPGVRIRTNSLRIGTKRIQGTGRKSGSPSISCGKSRRIVSDSFAVVKSSSDPRRDFMESMVEMILENNIRDSKALEDLLACYLQLNSDDYHEIIIKVFKQIWFDLHHS